MILRFTLFFSNNFQNFLDLTVLTLQFWAVVEAVGEEGDLFVVSSNWMDEVSGEFYTHFPPKSSMNPEQLALKRKEPGDNWQMFQINILKTKLGIIFEKFFSPAFF